MTGAVHEDGRVIGVFVLGGCMGGDEVCWVMSQYCSGRSSHLSSFQKARLTTAQLTNDHPSTTTKSVNQEKHGQQHKPTDRVNIAVTPVVSSMEPSNANANGGNKKVKSCGWTPCLVSSLTVLRSVSHRVLLRFPLLSRIQKTYCLLNTIL